MKNKLFRNCARVSTVLFIVFIGLYIYAWIFDQSFLHIPLGKASIAVHKYESGQVIFFNGPYPNATTTLGPTDTETFWEGYGIYHRVINDSASKVTWWTLMISLWYPLILFGILPAIFVVKKLRGRQSLKN